MGYTKPGGTQDLAQGLQFARANSQTRDNEADQKVITARCSCLLWAAQTKEEIGPSEPKGWGHQTEAGTTEYLSSRIWSPGRQAAATGETSRCRR